MLLFAERMLTMKEMWFILGFAVTLVAVITTDKALEKKGRC